MHLHNQCADSWLALATVQCIHEDGLFLVTAPAPMLSVKHPRHSLPKIFSLQGSSQMPVNTMCFLAICSLCTICQGLQFIALSTAQVKLHRISNLLRIKQGHREYTSIVEQGFNSSGSDFFFYTLTKRNLHPYFLGLFLYLVHLRDKF